MRIGQGHLSYCTNIHAGETWPQVQAALAQHLPTIKSQVSPEQAFGLGLRLGAEAANDLSKPGHLESLQHLLGQDFYVFTINGFPFGRFHATPVKEQVYKPDWRDPARLQYSNQLAELLVQLLPNDISGSISTLPGTYRPWLEQSDDQHTYKQDITFNLLRHAAHLHGLHKKTGKLIQLALEPEPFCLFERSSDVIAFYQDQLLNPAALTFLGELCQCSTQQAETILRLHIGVCLDVCHQSVVFEDPIEAVRRYQAAGIVIAKCQLSAALRVHPANAEQRKALNAFNDEVYLHQTFIKEGKQIQAFHDLGPALQQAKGEAAAEWRCHFHVPVFLEQLDNFHSTQPDLIALLQHHKQQPISEHLEVETYTWDVLPKAFRNTSIDTAIARELNWVKEQLAT